MGSIFNKIAIGVVVALIIGAVVFVLVVPKEQVKQSTIGEIVPEQGAEHITQGSTQHEQYNTNPPSSGPHWPQPVSCRIYTEEVADEAVLHSLEHGAVWVSYKNKDDKELAGQLSNLVESNATKVVLSPRASNDSSIAVVSWGKILKLESFDESQIGEFIKSNRNSSPEPLAAC